MSTVETGGAGDGADFDAERQLCDDGNCLGVIVGGKCNVCGLAAAASPRDNGSGQTGGNAAASPRDNGSGQTGGNAATSPRDNGSGQTGGLATQGAGDEDAFDEDRRLCPDGACTGLIGPDSKCKVCGRTYSDSAS